MAKKNTVSDQPAFPSDSEDKWASKRDYETLVDAEEIKGDPERLERAKSVFEKQKKAFTSLDQVKAYKNEKYGSNVEAADADVEVGSDDE